MHRTIRVILYSMIGLILICSSLVAYVYSTTKIVNLINFAVTRSVLIMPEVMAEFFLFNLRGTNKDINELKTEDGGLNYVVAVLMTSNFSKEKKVKFLKYFISKGCTVNDISNIDGLRPLHTAVAVADTDMVKLLLENGADPFLKSAPTGMLKISMTPLEMAESFQKKSTDRDYSKVIEALRKAEESAKKKG